MTIRNWLYLTAISTTILLGVLFVSLVVINRDLRNEYARAELAAEITKSFGAISLIYAKYQHRPSNRVGMVLSRRVDQFDSLIDRSGHLIPIARTKVVLASLQQSLKLLLENDRILGQAVARDLTAAETQRLAFMNARVSTVIQAEIQKILEVALVTGADANQRLRELHRTLEAGLYGLVLAIFILVSVSSLLLARIISVSLRSIQAGANELSSGNLDYEIEYSGRDELGDLATSMNLMAARIKEQQTDLSEALMAAERANQAKSEFLASMSHDLRTPLNAIVGFSDIMASQTFGPLGSARYRDYARNIQQCGDLLTSLVNDILDLAKIESGEYRLDETDVDINQLVRNAIDVNRIAADDQDRDVTLAASDEIAGIRADRRVVVQILNNILSNAFKFSPKGSGIAVTVDLADDKGVRIEVSDNGIGMSEEDLRTVLAPFTRASSEISRTQEGTGLGLYLVDKLMALHGGSLEIRSRLNVGTTATVRFPPARSILGRDASAPVPAQIAGTSDRIAKPS